MDVLSQLLDGVSIRGSVFCHGEVRAPWCLAGGAEGICLFHVVVDGHAVAWVDDDAVIELSAGDLMLLVRGRSHHVGSEISVAARKLGDAVARTADSDFARIVSDGDGPPATLICGTFEVGEMTTHPLLRALPDVMVVRGDDASWLHATITALDDQIRNNALGSVAVVNRLAEILFVQAVAAWLAVDEDARDNGWLRGLNDPNVGRALAAMHAHPDEVPSMAALARSAGMSRSGFYRRFTELLGEPPAAYLKRWRMTLASRWLSEDSRTLDEISDALGYSGVSAFSRAFKTDFGVAPGRWRALQN